MVTSVTFTCSILPPQAIEQLGGRPPFDSQAQDEPPQENSHARLNPELLKLIFTAIQNATNPALDFSNPNFSAHDIEQIIDDQNPEKQSQPDDVDELAKLVLLHKAISVKMKNEIQHFHDTPYLPATKKEETQTQALASSKAVASLEKIELKVEHLIEANFAKHKSHNPELALLRKADKEVRDSESRLGHEGRKSAQQQKNQQEEKTLLKELVKGEFEKNRAELAKVGIKNIAELTKAKTEEVTRNLKDATQSPIAIKKPEHAERPDIRRAEKALEHAIKSLMIIPAPNPIPQQIIANIMVPYAAIQNAESANGKEKRKTQKKKKKAPKQKKRIFRKLLKKSLS